MLFLRLVFSWHIPLRRLNLSPAQYSSTNEKKLSTGSSEPLGGGDDALLGFGGDLSVADGMDMDVGGFFVVIVSYSMKCRWKSRILRVRG